MDLNHVTAEELLGEDPLVNSSYGVTLSEDTINITGSTTATSTYFYTDGTGITFPFNPTPVDRRVSVEDTDGNEIIYSIEREDIPRTGDALVCGVDEFDEPQEYVVVRVKRMMNEGDRRVVVVVVPT